MADDTARQASSGELKELRAEAGALKDRWRVLSCPILQAVADEQTGKD